MAARLDTALVERGLCRSRSRAGLLIREGRVRVNGITVTKPAGKILPEDVLTVEDLPFVGRGGLKLAGALEAFPVTPEGAVCLDVGASTGGFTDCLLQRGAKLVYAVDVGHDQLDAALRADERVVCMEGTDVRDLTALPQDPAFCSIDVSFISLKLVLPAVYPLLAPHAQCIALVKPQFEAGRRHIGKNGIVRDARVHAQVLGDVLTLAQGLGFAVQGLCVSPVQGGSGNTEFLVHLEKGAQTAASPEALIRALSLR
ncbi:MAG: TlyA family RNA methyltransferase [Oscillospiraceae bacterium]|nr:TlyA family RNA methyltransferase [Oscillospiraceae bacterium]